jgi:hypothetical protein
MTPAIPVELIALPGERHISELEDIDAVIRLYKPKVFRFVAFPSPTETRPNRSPRIAFSRPSHSGSISR